ncbi:MAG: hypothetical protein EOO77_23950 [Oxalobacteraceae bacterium]|nr:MAG: hypothetical protein EOO77_23950 [Oxalobacteraceae bacterium]
MIEQEFHRGWYDNSIIPKPTVSWLRQHWPELLDWIDANIQGEWEFRVRLISFEYDSYYSTYALIIAYVEMDDAFLHRMRW